LSYDAELQFVVVAESVMYYRDQDPQLTDIDCPTFKAAESDDLFNTFIAEKES
jgi:hypothetical protein